MKLLSSAPLFTRGHRSGQLCLVEILCTSCPPDAIPKGFMSPSGIEPGICCLLRECVTHWGALKQGFKALLLYVVLLCITCPLDILIFPLLRVTWLTSLTAHLLCIIHQPLVNRQQASLAVCLLLQDLLFLMVDLPSHLTSVSLV